MSVIFRTLETIKALKQSKQFLALAEAHSNLMGYRKQGYFYDDLIPDESPLVQEALHRLTPEQRMQRLYRIRRGLNLSMKKISLPKEEWTKPEQDVAYLAPILKQLEAEALTRNAYENGAIPAALLARNRSS